jgi:hypothetical protein
MSRSAKKSLPVLATSVLLALAVLAVIGAVRSAGQQTASSVPSRSTVASLQQASPVTSHVSYVSWAVPSDLGSTMRPPSSSLFDITCPIGGRMSVLHCAYCLIPPHFLMRGVGCPNWLNGYR